MSDIDISKLVSDEEYFKAARELINNYLGENVRSFEREDLDRRSRILEMQMREKGNNLSNEEEDNEEIIKGILQYAEKALTVLISEDEITVEEIPSEDEDIETGVPIYKIGSYPSDPTLEGLKTKYDRGEIIIPRFQRGWVWTPSQASRLIESFLLGLPVPSIFVYKEISGKQIVIDGQQRLRTIWGFFDGVLPDGTSFYLRGVDPQWNGKKYDDLNETDKIRFRDSILRVVIVEQLNPDDYTSIYHIFERLNTGGTGLTPQEVRNSSYHGPFNDLMFDLNNYEKWKQIFGKDYPDPRMRDHELIVRFLALEEGGYSKPMKSFLNLFMAKHQFEKDLDKYTELFTETCDRVINGLGPKPFHIKRGINVAVYDSVMVAFSKNKRVPPDIIKRYEKLLANPSYQDSISSSTTDTDTLSERHKLAINVLFG
ncbi:DUF262 domain-containing protein [Chloroflexota bacterium]